MKRFIIVLILTISVFHHTAFADIVQTQDLDSVIKSIEKADKNTLVIFDVDDVLVTAKDQILQPMYKNYNNSLAKEIEKRHSKAEAENLWSIILLAYADELVDPRLPLLIRDIQAREVKLLALTNLLTGSFGKILSIEDWRIARLEHFNIRFSDSWIGLPQKRFMNFNPKDPRRFPAFKKGVLFAAGFPKGEVLQAFLHYSNFKPKMIIFIDDKQHHLESIESFCSKQEIDFVGFEYIAVKSKSHSTLNESRAKYQFDVLEKMHKWLSDEEANQPMHK